MEFIDNIFDNDNMYEQSSSNFVSSNFIYQYIKYIC